MYCWGRNVLIVDRIVEVVGQCGDLGIVNVSVCGKLVGSELVVCLIIVVNDVGNVVC